MNRFLPQLNWSFNPLLRHPLRLWLAACYNVTALPVAVVTFSLIIAMLSTSVGLLITFLLAMPFAWLMFVLSRGFGHLERNRVAALAGVRDRRPGAAAHVPRMVGAAQGTGELAPALARRSPTTSPICRSPPSATP